MRNQHKLLLEQVDFKLKPFHQLKSVQLPLRGWIFTIRTSLNMTLFQLGQRLGITSQGVKDIENREASGSITIKSLREVGEALDLKFVYGFIPNEGSLEKLIESKANDLAKKIVLRTSHNMKLEDQGLSDKRINLAIKELSEELKREMRRSIWD